MAQCLEYNKNRLKCPKWHCHCAGTSLYRSGKYYGKQRLNKWVLRRLLKTSNEGADLTCCGRLIQWTRTERHRVLLQLLRKLFSNITGNDTNVLLSNEASIENFRKKHWANSFRAVIIVIFQKSCLNLNLTFPFLDSTASIRRRCCNTRLAK